MQGGRRRTQRITERLTPEAREMQSDLFTKNRQHALKKTNHIKLAQFSLVTSRNRGERGSYK